jgi:hypothetical protein
MLKGIRTYKGKPCRILADYGDQIWIEIDCERYLIYKDELEVRISAHN